MAGTWKTVRVFISSTFRDMHAERDHLVKVVFPRLRQWCGERRLHLVDIDLRWGVTKEEADNGKALEICLQEIDGSRPFFLCLLGDRYGWVPDELPPEEMYQFHGLQSQTHLSITHLEIQHAALAPIARTDGQAKPICQQSFFYFRASGCVPAADLVPPAYRDAHSRTFFESLPERSAMLDVLKLAIRKRYAADDRVFDYEVSWDADAENPEDDRLHGRLTALAAFGRRVEADIQRGICEQFAEHLAALAEPVDPVEDERAQHAAFIENRTRVHVPRLGVEQAVSDYVWGTSERPLVLSGPPGSGKSAILAHWLKQNAELDHNTWLAKRDGATPVLARFIGASSASTNLTRLLAGICEELRRRLELTEIVEEEVEVGPGQKEKRTRTQNMEVPADPMEVMRKWPKFLAAAAERGRVVLIIDAVNQLDRLADPALAFWIPHRLPPGIRLVISVLDYGEKSWPECQPAAEEPADWLRQLRRAKLASASDQTELAVPELDDASRQRIIRDLPSVFCKTLEPHFVEQLSQNAATRNPLFLLVALEELRVFGSFDKLPQRIAQLPQADDPQRIDEALDAIFGQVLDRLDADVRRQEKQLRGLPADTGLVPTLFRLLASAHEGLSERELAELLALRFKDIDQEPRDGALQFVLRQVRPYLMWKAHPQGLLVDFYHRSFWKAVRRKYCDACTTDRIAAIYQALTEYFADAPYFLDTLEAHRSAAIDEPLKPRRANTRKVAELPRHLVQFEAILAKTGRHVEWEAIRQSHRTLWSSLHFYEAASEGARLAEVWRGLKSAIAHFAAEADLATQLQAVSAVIRHDLAWLTRRPTLFFQAVHNRLSRSGDADKDRALYRLIVKELREHSDRKIGDIIDEHDSGADIEGSDPSRLLVERWRLEKERTTPGFIWLRTMHHVAALDHPLPRRSYPGHGSRVTAVMLSPDGRVVATAGDDGEVWLWDRTSEDVAAKLRAHTKCVSALAFSPDGQRLATVSWAGEVFVWDVTRRMIVRSLSVPDETPTSVSWNGNSTLLAVGCAGGSVYCWDCDNDRPMLHVTNHAEPIHQIVFSPHSDVLYVLDGAHRLFACDVARRAPSMEFAAIDDVVGIGEDDSGVLAMVNKSHEWVQLVELPSGREVGIQWNLPTGVMPSQASIQGRSRQAALLDFNGDVFLLRQQSPLPLQVGSHEGVIATISQPAESGAVFSAGSRLESGIALEWSIADGDESLNEIASFVHEHRKLRAFQNRAAGSHENIYSVSELIGVSADTSWLVDFNYSPSGGGHFGVWSIDSGCLTSTIGKSLMPLHRPEFRSSAAAISPDGWLLGACLIDGTVRIWDVGTTAIFRSEGKDPDEMDAQMAQLQKFGGVFRGDPTTTEITFSPDGRFWAVGLNREEVVVYALHDGELVRRFSTSGQPTFRLTWSCDGRYLARIGRPGVVNVWRICDGKEILSLRLAGVADRVAVGAGLGGLPFMLAGYNDISFSWDGLLFAVVSDSATSVYRLDGSHDPLHFATGGQQLRFQSDSNVVLIFPRSRSDEATAIRVRGTSARQSAPADLAAGAVVVRREHDLVLLSAGGRREIGALREMEGGCETLHRSSDRRRIIASGSNETWIIEVCGTLDRPPTENWRADDDSHESTGSGQSGNSFSWVTPTRQYDAIQRAWADELSVICPHCRQALPIQQTSDDRATCLSTVTSHLDGSAQTLHCKSCGEQLRATPFVCDNRFLAESAGSNQMGKAGGRYDESDYKIIAEKVRKNLATGFHQEARQSALALFQQAAADGNSKWQANALMMTADALESAGLFTEVVAPLVEADRISSTAGIWRTRAICSHRLALLYMRFGDMAGCVDASVNAQEAYRLSGNDLGTARCHFVCAQGWFAQKCLDEALDECERAEKLCRTAAACEPLGPAKANDMPPAHQTLSGVLLQKAEILIELGRLDDGENTSLKQILLLSDMMAPELLAHSIHRIVMALMDHTGNPTRGLEWLHLAHRIIEDKGGEGLEAQVLREEQILLERNREEFNDLYHRALENWSNLPFWKRWFVPKPRRPE
ncbi:MAG: DUF4062 domain-containing protein [Planctomycetaceae bacterium]|nr:DUF4062 domain-containing protein [Planctomycetaceae bacterium]